MNFNNLLNNKKFFADMLLSACENKDDIKDIRFFTDISNIDIYTVNRDTQYNDCIICIYADYYDIDNDISTASIYFRVTKTSTVSKNMNTLLYSVEYLNMLDCH